MTIPVRVMARNRWDTQSESFKENLIKELFIKYGQGIRKQRDSSAF